MWSLLPCCRYVNKLCICRDLHALQAPLAYYQNQVWDPEVGDPTFPEFCEYLKKPPLSLLGFGGLTGSNGPAVDHALLNYAQWIREVIQFSYLAVE
jgi:hypothetical protein